MDWPLPQDYTEAVRAPAGHFLDPDLKTAAPISTRPRAGDAAVVYPFAGADGRRWAVKCFTRPVAPDLDARYAAVADHLARANLPFTVGFDFLPAGVRVKAVYYPAVKMPWVDGIPVNQFVRDHLNRATVLEAVLSLWVRLCRRLREAGVAHGDLQHGNVLLVPGAKPNALGLKLVDYDGMYVPALAGRPPGEAGHAAYQHPDRAATNAYSADLDRFPHLVVATALRGLLVGGRALWAKYDTGDNLLFAEKDFRAPGRSKLMRELWDTGDPFTVGLLAHLVLACGKPLAQTPWLDHVLTEGRPPALTPSQERQVAAALGAPIVVAVPGPPVAPVPPEPPPPPPPEPRAVPARPRLAKVVTPDPAADDAPAPRPRKDRPPEPKSAVRPGMFIGAAVAGLILLAGLGTAWVVGTRRAEPSADPGPPADPPPVAAAPAARPFPPLPPGPVPGVPPPLLSPAPAGGADGPAAVAAAVATAPVTPPAFQAWIDPDPTVIPREVHFSPDGDRVVITTREVAKVYVLLVAARIVNAVVPEPAAPVRAFPVAKARVFAYPDGARAARIWYASDGRPLETVPVPHRGAAEAKGVTPDGRVAVIDRGDDVVLLDTATGEVTPTVGACSYRVYGGLSPDGTRLLIVADGVVRVFAVPHGREVGACRMPAGCLAAALAPGGKLGVVLGAGDPPGRADPVIQVFDPATGRTVRALTGPFRISGFGPAHRFSPDGRFLATTVKAPGDGPRTRIVFWDTTTWRPVAAIAGDPTACAYDFSPDSRWVVTAGPDRFVRVYDLTAPGAPEPAVPAPSAGPTTPPPPVVSTAPGVIPPAAPAVPGALVPVARDAGGGWVSLFRSADPAVWNTDTDRGRDDYAVPLSAAPADVRYLRLTDARTGQVVIVSMTNDRLGRQSEAGGYGWNGANLLLYQGRHLGVYDPAWKSNARGTVAINHNRFTLIDEKGWGFGHRTLLDDAQAYSWAGDPIGRTVFEVAVKTTALTPGEEKLLLKK